MYALIAAVMAVHYIV